MSEMKQLERRGITVEMVSELTGYTPVEIALISRTVAVGAPLEELAVFLHAMRALKLDALLRQGYWIRRGNPPRGTLQVGIDGFRAIAERTGVYAGSEPAEFKDWTKLDGDLRVPGVARVRVWKVVDGRTAAFTGEAAWPEFYPGPGAQGQMWRKMPRHMLAKCAEAQALRKAFPALLAAVNMGEQDEDVLDGPTVQVQQVRDAAEYDRVFGEEARRPSPAQAAAGARAEAEADADQEEPEPPDSTA